MKTKGQYIVEAIKKIEATCSHLELLLKSDMYSVEPLLKEIHKHQEILIRIYEGREDERAYNE